MAKTEEGFQSSPKAVPWQSKNVKITACLFDKANYFVD